MALQLYAWKRLWYPREGQVSLADGGFLLDPNSQLAKYIPTDVAPFDSISGTECLVLLGEPGIGKSTSLRGEFAIRQQTTAINPGYVEWADLSDFSSEEAVERTIAGSEEIRHWQANSGMLDLFLDSFDEALLRIDNIARVLLRLLRKLPVERLRLRIASRPRDWQGTLESGLGEIFGESKVRVFQLAPLLKSDVRLAAESSGIDANAFIEEVTRKDVVPFAIKPVTLRFLIDAFAAERALPETRAELYLRGCRRLCEEHSHDRRDSPILRERLAPSERMAVAGRIAAVTQFSSRSAIWIGSEGETPTSDVALELLAGGCEGEPPREFTVDVGAVRETLGTGLFSSVGLRRQNWQHQTYAEYLAAYYLNSHDLSPDRLRSLIFHQDGSGKVIPQLREVAAWLASMDQGAFEILLRSDPETLLRSDIDTMSNADQAALVGQLLKSFESSGVTESIWTMREALTHLNNPGLPDIIRPYLVQPSRPLGARYAAIRIAGVCGVTGLEGDLAKVALSQVEPIGLRTSAAHCIADRGDRASRKALRPLALGLAGDDPDDELKGCGLLATWPDFLTTDELFSAITPIKNRNLLGSYVSPPQGGTRTQSRRPAKRVEVGSWVRQE